MASVTCSNCQTVAAEGAVTCPSCGNALSGVGSTSAASSIPPSAPPSGPPSGAPGAPGAPRPQIKFDLASIGHVDRIVGGGTLILFIALFLPWFKVNFTFGSVSASGLTAHGYLYIPLILAIGVIAFIAAEMLGVWKLPASSALARDQILLIATAINFVLVLIGFLAKPGGSAVGWDWGAFVGLIASIVAVFPLGWPIIQARRKK
jgi:hypothetical protein